MNLERLKQETRADHRAVEEAVPLMSQDLNRDRYLRCLQRIHGIVTAWEECAVESAPGWLTPALLARQRSRLLKNDLTFFGIGENEDGRPALPPMTDLPSLLGAMYVMEGSALGGRFIARHVEEMLGLFEGHGNSYFRGHGSETGPLWKEFCEMLKTRVPDEETPIVVASAKAMFRTYGIWMRRNSVVGAG